MCKNEHRPTITVAPPRPSLKRMLIKDMPPGTVFVNTYHSIETIMSGREHFSIYMKMCARNEGASRSLEVTDWETPLVVNLRNGNAYNLRNKHNAPTEGYVMSAELTVRLLGQ